MAIPPRPDEDAFVTKLDAAGFGARLLELPRRQRCRLGLRHRRRRVRRRRLQRADPLGGLSHGEAAGCQGRCRRCFRGGGRSRGRSPLPSPATSAAAARSSRRSPVAATPSGDAYVAGTTGSTDFPTQSPFQPEAAGWRHRRSPGRLRRQDRSGRVRRAARDGPRAAERSGGDVGRDQRQRLHRRQRRQLRRRGRCQLQGRLGHANHRRQPRIVGGNRRGHGQDRRRRLAAQSDRQVRLRRGRLEPHRLARHRARPGQERDRHAAPKRQGARGRRPGAGRRPSRAPRSSTIRPRGAGALPARCRCPAASTRRRCSTAGEVLVAGGSATNAIGQVKPRRSTTRRPTAGGRRAR